MPRRRILLAGHNALRGTIDTPDAQLKPLTRTTLHGRERLTGLAAAGPEYEYAPEAPPAVAPRNIVRSAEKRHMFSRRPCAVSGSKRRAISRFRVLAASATGFPFTAANGCR